MIDTGICPVLVVVGDSQSERSGRAFGRLLEPSFSIQRKLFPISFVGLGSCLSCRGCRKARQWRRVRHAALLDSLLERSQRMKHLRSVCCFVLIAIFVAALTEPVWAACDDSISAMVTVDTRSSFSISGRVVDDRSGLGLAGATVQLGGGGASATTAANGAFMVSGGSFGEGSQLKINKKQAIFLAAARLL